MDLYSKNYSFWDLFSKTSEIFRNNFKYLLLISLIIYLPLNIILEYVSQFILSEDFTLKEFSNYTKLAGFLQSVLWVIAEIFIIFLVKWYIDGKEETFNGYLKNSFSFWWKGALANIYYSIMVWLLLILLIVPWIIFAFYWIFFLQILVLKDKKVNYLKYSKELVKWKWWNIFWNIIVLYLILIVFSIWLWIIQGIYPFLDNLYANILVGYLLDFINIFILIFITLKFLNLDGIKSKKFEEIKNENEAVEL